MKLKQLQSFLGLCNYYRCFIDGFGQIACPLNDLTKKNVPYTWGEAQQNTFDMLKTQFTKAPLLVFPNSLKDMHIETDASNIATGVVLLVLGENSSWHPYAFLSHSFAST